MSVAADEDWDTDDGMDDGPRELNDILLSMTDEQLDKFAGKIKADLLND